MNKANHTKQATTYQAKRKLHGVGYNSGSKHPIRENNKKTELYSLWTAIIQRCYSAKFQSRHPTYIGCTVAEEWHNFQNFAEWYTNHKFYGLGYHLDKDLLFINNTVYSPKTCTLVPRVINNLLSDSRASRGDLPQGVYFDKEVKKYKAQINISGKVINLGRYSNPNEASKAYIKHKERHVKNKALEWANRIEWGVFKNLMLWAVAKPESYSEPDLTKFVEVTK